MVQTLGLVRLDVVGNMRACSSYILSHSHSNTHNVTEYHRNELFFPMRNEIFIVLCHPMINQCSEFIPNFLSSSSFLCLFVSHTMFMTAHHRTHLLPKRKISFLFEFYSSQCRLRAKSIFPSYARIVEYIIFN